MDKRRERLFDLAVIIIITILTLPILAFCLGSSSGLGESWNVQPHVSTSGDEVRSEYSVFKLNYGENQTLNSIYLNVAAYEDLTDDKLELTFYFTNSESQAKGSSVISTLQKTAIIEEVSKNAYRFVSNSKLQNLSESSKYVRIGVKNSILINEIVFVDKNNKTIVADYIGSRTWQSEKYDFYYATELGELGAAGAVDASDSLVFSNSGAVNFSDKQADLAAAVNSFLSGNGYFVSKTHGPLGVAFASIGTAIFKTGLFGLCFIGYLCLLCSFYIIYFTGKNFFENRIYAICSVVIFAVCGIGISSAIGASASSIALPFIAGAFALAFAYLKNPIKRPKSIALSGILFSFAVAIDFTSISCFIVLAACAVIGLTREVKVFADYNDYGGLEREYRREKYKKALISSVFKAIAAFIVLPILFQIISYGITFVSYAEYYAETNIFAIIVKNNNALFSASKNDGSLIFSWLLGIGSENAKLFGDNTAKICANSFVVLIGSLSVVFLIVYAILKSRKQKTQKGQGFFSLASANEIFSVTLFFLSSFLSLAIFGFYGAYQSFVCSQLACCFSILLAFKLLKNEKERLACFLAVATVVIAVLFEVACFTEIFQLDFFPSIATVVFDGIKSIF